MKTLILKGKYKYKIVEVSQWCNDWFSVSSADPNVARKIYSPLALAFTLDGMMTIKGHKNNGMMFGVYEFFKIEDPFKSNKGEVYEWRFKKRKHGIK